MKEFHGSVQIEVEFTFVESHPATPASKDKSGQPINPKEPPQWEITNLYISG